MDRSLNAVYIAGRVMRFVMLREAASLPFGKVLEFASHDEQSSSMSSRY
jgi:hypothetical protein